MQQEQIRAVIETFYKVVNISDDYDPPSSDTMTRDEDTGKDTSDDTPTATLQYTWADGPSDTPPSLPSDQCPCEQSNKERPRPDTLHRANSTNSKYDAFRKAIVHQRDSKKYYEQWLVECRLEIREIVGPEGPWIKDPPMLKW